MNPFVSSRCWYRHALSFEFYWLLREPRNERGKTKWTVGRVAEAIHCSQSTVNDAVNNRRRGRQTRRKLVRFFKKECPNWRDLIAALDWDAAGEIVARGTFHMEQR